MQGLSLHYFFYSGPFPLGVDVYCCKNAIESPVQPFTL